MINKKSIQGMMSLTKVVGLSALMASTLYATDDNLTAIASEYLGKSAFITNNALGEITATPITSAESIPYGTFGVGLGDFDNDGLMDYVIGAYNHIEFFKRTGPGNSFAGGVNIAGISTGNIRTGDFAVADYDNDEKLDFAVNIHELNIQHIYLGNGDGTFYLHSEIPIPFFSHGMDSEDINNDGHADFVSLQLRGYDITKTVIQTHLGDGNGGFTTQIHELNNVANYPYRDCTGMSLTDLNNDGNADLVLTYNNPSSNANNLLEVHFGHGNGTFIETGFATGKFDAGDFNMLHNNRAAIDDGDFDHDGNRDIIIAFPHSVDVMVLFGNGDGTLTPSGQGIVPVPLTTFWTLSAISTAPYLIDTNSPPIAEADGPYWETTDDVLLEVNPGALNIDSSGKWLKVKIYTNPEGTASVHLDASASTDPDDDTLTYDWVVTNNENSTSTNFLGETPTINLSPGSYSVMLTVTDSSGETSTDSSAIVVSLLDIETVTAADVFLNGIVGEFDQYLSHEDDPDKEPEQIIRFDRSAVSETLDVGEDKLIVITGSVNGFTTIKTIDSNGKGKGKSNN